MFKYIFSFKFGNIHPAGTTTTTPTTSNAFNAADKPVVIGGNNEGTVKESPLIQSVRQQRRQQLEEMALIRKIAHQSFMNQYAVDHLPLSQVQEKLEEDNLPLIQLQQKLKQTDDNLTVYTTTKENLRSLFYNQRKSHGLLMKPRKFRPTNRKDHNDNNNNNNNNVDDNSNPTKDDRDYDVWDDAVIGRIMNLVDTIGVEPGEAIQETHSTDEGSTFSATISGNAEEKSDSKDRETIVAENVQEDCETQPVEAAEEATEYDEPDDEGSTGKRNATIIQVTTLTTTTSAKRPDGLTRGDSMTTILSIESDNKRESGFWKRNSILSPSSFFSNREKNHSEFSGGDDDLMDQRSIVSVTSKVSIDDFDDRDKRSIPLLKKLWKPKRQKDQTKETSSNRLMKLKQYSSGSLSKKYYNNEPAETR